MRLSSGGAREKKGLDGLIKNEPEGGRGRVEVQLSPEAPGAIIMKALYKTKSLPPWPFTRLRPRL